MSGDAPGALSADGVELRHANSLLRACDSDASRFAFADQAVTE
jgi:hypothetical protein